MINKRKGVTLMEMTIVIAVIGIISTIVVSFTMMIGQRAGVGSGKMDALNEIEMTKAIVEAWVDKVEAAGGSFAISNEDAGGAETQLEDEVAQITANLTAKIGDEEPFAIVLDLENGMLTASLPDGQTLSCPAESMQDIQFAMAEKTADDDSVTDRIIFCTLTYEIPKAGLTASTEEKTLTFCINSHLSGN